MIVVTVFERLGMSYYTQLGYAGIVGAIGLGPSIAYYFQRRLRANGRSLGVGCGALIIWTVLLGVGAATAGFVGAAIGLTAGVVVAARLTRPRP